MKKYSMLQRDDALAGVIEALLMVALVAIILSMIQLYYIPQIMEQREADHMEVVANQFSQLKSVIEIQSKMGVMGEETGSTSPLMYTTMSSPITLGSNELPYFVTAKSYGYLAAIDRDETTSYIEVLGSVHKIFSLTSINYLADNHYFVEQVYNLEGGGLIVYQPGEGESMRIQPTFTKDNGSAISIYYSLPIFICPPGKDIAGGIKNEFVYTNYSGKEASTIVGDLDKTKNHYIKIKTEYLNAWNQSLNKIFEEEIENDYVNIYINEDYVKIEPDQKDIIFEMEVVYIEIQIGPGLVD